MGAVTPPRESPDAAPVMLAVDAGNSKTDVAVLRADGTVLATARGSGFGPQHRGVPAAVDGLGRIVAKAAAKAGVRLPVHHLTACAANADLPVEERRLRAEVDGRGWAHTAAVTNDTFAVLRSCTSAADAVAVVCGAGINCVGRTSDGRTARFPALGRTTGDWGGGAWLFEEVLWWSVRAEDGRGPATALARAAAGHFGRAQATDIAVDAHLGTLPWHRLHELVPVLCAVAEAGDEVALRILDRQAEEVAVLATAALTRLGRLDRATDVALGGGVLAARPPHLLRGVRTRMAARAPRARLIVATVPPIAGAALLALDHAAEAGTITRQAHAAAEPRLRAAFSDSPERGQGGRRTLA
ncbi:N-acetylglucosamine kinase [Streptodolium elevatio]|uniref:BadF/BadG/BcrA/BcrD ATPase family protein n=1 Tax=Streptodolium elevatio TaxID=3157996 RepID=A0ABV3DH41_9ACTN